MEMMIDDFTLGCIAAVTSVFVALIISVFMVRYLNRQTLERKLKNGIHGSI
ncbi:hypothetical protein [Ferrovum sp.]|jgi:ABC-type phosphate transport system permease subunit|uniref:hypothetical protein n=1 Tax=Ferrovum sp. TaxID=2609467 RepID=UPI0026283A38|nr:hypothetical protein [Ferrovum sp.]